MLTSSWHLNQIPVAAPWLVRVPIQKARPMIKTLAQSGKSTLLTCPSELLEYYRFEYNKEGTKAIKATCIVCSNHWGKISSEYRGKLTDDVITYAIRRTGCLQYLSEEL